MRQNFIDTIIPTISGFMGYYLGGFDKALEVLFVFMVIDYITGIIKAYKEKKLSSNIGAKGILKKVGYICLIVVAMEIDSLLGSKGMFRTLILYSFIANEGLSILENCNTIGITIPNKIKEALMQFQEKTKETN